MTQIGEHLTSKHNILNSNPSTDKKKKRKYLLSYYFVINISQNHLHEPLQIAFPYSRGNHLPCQFFQYCEKANTLHCDVVGTVPMTQHCGD
jgi:hypothetical protein